MRGQPVPVSERRHFVLPALPERHVDGDFAQSEPPRPVEGDVVVDMTLTAQGCPSHAEISRDIRMTILSTPGVNTCKVNVVWDPPWTPERISPEGRQKLGIEDE